MHERPGQNRSSRESSGVHGSVPKRGAIGAASIGSGIASRISSKAESDLGLGDMLIDDIDKLQDANKGRSLWDMKPIPHPSGTVSIASLASSSRMPKKKPRYLAISGNSETHGSSFMARSNSRSNDFSSSVRGGILAAAGGSSGPASPMMGSHGRTSHDRTGMGSTSTHGWDFTYAASGRPGSPLGVPSGSKAPSRSIKFIGSVPSPSEWNH